jgi:signal transduction histidine kinase
MTGVLIASSEGAPCTVTYADVAALSTLAQARDAIVGHDLFTVLGANGLATVLSGAVARGEACHVRLPLAEVDGARCERRITLTPLQNVDTSCQTLVTIEDVAFGADARPDPRGAAAIVDLVSHELRSPLNSALTWVSLLEIDQTPKTLDRAVEVIRQSIQTQALLIDDLVEVGRANRRQPLEVEPADLHALIGETVDAVRSTLPQHTTLDFATDGGRFAITADAARLGRAVRHLLDNAVKFMPRGGTVTAELRAVDGSAQFEVRDEGVGLSADDIARTFSLFWRAQPKLRGGGLGLGVVHTVISRHKGVVCARSAGLGKGAAFTIALPLG